MDSTYHSARADCYVTLASVAQARWTGCLFLLNHCAYSSGFHCDELGSRCLEPVGTDGGYVVSGDVDRVEPNVLRILWT